MKSEQLSKKAHVISFNPDGEYYFQKGMAAYQKGDLKRACKFIERAIVFKPDEVEYLCQQAAILTELEEYEASTALLKKVIYELDDKMTECHFFMANNYAYLGLFHEALQEVKAYLSLEPNGMYWQEADELLRLLLSEAGDDFEEEASYVSAHERGRRALEHGHYAEAMTLFRKVIKEKPDFWAAQNNLAIAYFSMGLSEKALDILYHVLKYDGGNIHALCNMATFYFQMGDQAKLRETLDRLDKLYPYFPEHCGKLGSTYLFIGEYDRAFQWLLAAEKTGARTDQAFYFWLALSAYRTGRPDVAKRAWKQVDFFRDKPFHPFQYGKVQDMLFEDDAKSNFMVHSLLLEEIRNGSRAEQLFSLFYLYHLGEKEWLAEAAGKTRGGTLRLVATRLLAAAEHEKKDESLSIMLQVQEYLTEGRPIVNHCELYAFWAVVDNLLEGERQVDVPGWTATLIYLWEKEAGVRTSQAKNAKLTGTTVYRIRKHVDELTVALEKHRKSNLTVLK